MARTKYNKPRKSREPRSGPRTRTPAFRGQGNRMVKRMDNYGRTYGGSINALNLHKNQDFSPTPHYPKTEAMLSTAQYVNNFSVASGIGAGSTTTLSYLTATPGTSTQFAIAFTAGDLPQFTSFAALFDQYRIDRVEIKFSPQSNAVNVLASSSPNATVPNLFCLLDFDDSVAPTSLGAVQQYDNCQVCKYGEGLHIVLEPSYTPAVYSAGAFTGYGVDKAGWLDVASSGIPHYGVKGSITALPGLSTSNVVWDIYCKYYISFRNVR